MKDILNTYSVKELKQFVSKYNKSLGAVKRYSVLKKAELVELMTKKENVGKFKSIKAKAKAPVPKKIEVRKSTQPKPKPPAPEPKPAKMKTPQPPKPAKMKNKINIISKEEMAKRREKKQKPKPKTELEQRTGKSKAEINKMKTSDVVSFLPAEIRGKIADEMGDTDIINGWKVPKQGKKMNYEEFYQKTDTTALLTADGFKRLARRVLGPNLRISTFGRSKMETLFRKGGDKKLREYNVVPFIRELAQQSKKKGRFDKEKIEKARKETQKEEKRTGKGSPFHTLLTLYQLFDYKRNKNVEKFMDFQIRPRREFEAGRGRDFQGGRSDTYAWSKDGKEKTNVVEKFIERQVEKMKINKKESTEEIKIKLKKIGDMGKEYVKKNGYKITNIRTTYLDPGA